MFASKKDAIAAIREVLYRYPIGATLRGEDERFICDLLAMHPEAQDKIGCGVASLQVEKNGPTRGFWLTRRNGKRTDFSFPSCLTPVTPERDALNGLRTAIRPQILAYRDEAFAGRDTVPCAATGAPVTRSSHHVDHVPGFAELVVLFLQERGCALGSLAVEPTRDGDTETRLADAEVLEAWREFHRQHASLRIVSVVANLSLLRKLTK
ncbi:MAG: DCL family protein [Deltaproteobacteria bacterium]|nr:DCL family protein [Deltaproteobacteria bacterium]